MCGVVLGTVCQEVFDQTKPIYLRLGRADFTLSSSARLLERLSENAFPDTAVCAWLNDLNEWSQELPSQSVSLTALSTVHAG